MIPARLYLVTLEGETISVHEDPFVAQIWRERLHPEAEIVTYVHPMETDTIRAAIARPLEAIGGAVFRKLARRVVGGWWL